MTQTLEQLQSRLAALEQEEKTLMTQTSSNQHEGMDSSLSSLSLEQLQNQLNHLEQEEKVFAGESHPEYSFWDRLKQMGKGFSSAAYQSGMGQGLADPWVNADPRLLLQKKNLKAEQQQESRKEEEYLQQLDSTGRILHRSGEWMESGVETPSVPMGNIKQLMSILGFTKALAAYLGKDAAIGAGSGVLQEEGMNPFLADILASLTGRNAHLLSPHSQGERSAGHIIKKAAQDTLKEGEAPLTVETALQAMKKQMGSEQAGEMLRKALLDKIQGLDDAAKDAIYKQYPQVKKDIHLRERVEQGNGLEKLWQKGDSAADSVREDRALGKILELGQDSRPYALGNAEIPELFLNKSMESVENAK